jgi:chorismate synthase
MASTFGQLFRVTTFGESHSRAVGVVIDGCPPQLDLSEADIQPQLDRRRPGQNELSSARRETDTVSIVAGVEQGRTLGSPICLIVANTDSRPTDYAGLQDIPRPSHADFTYLAKYGGRAVSGGGRASARETIGRVAAGAIAEKILRLWFGIEIVGWVCAIGGIETTAVDMSRISRSEVDRHASRCPDVAVQAELTSLIQQVQAEQDSIGGIIRCVGRNIPIGLGEPVFDGIKAKLAQAMLSIPACQGFEIGAGFAAAAMRGSRHNDPFCHKDGKIGTTTNNSGGVQGGISNGEPIWFRVAFKPTASIGQVQSSVNFQGEPVLVTIQGRHDPCVVPRAVPIVEAMTALVLLDAILHQKTSQPSPLPV